ncbi:CPBP family intramembrane glutamic endopeptidase [Caryophanon latum]|uniref:CAAX prenyl protease 2/Lysostaphin resistance protein A-like domain-containing protein n=1 Tax=Caryophanon latum TaxID=33977 RepID=A0A1C0YQ35_9BACL|nr:type II CAAX endopeptidase family protein [Caryophanon latum]OCS89272.1 hypothetical protein A6K76_13060 [Caryophanon latum]
MNRLHNWKKEDFLLLTVIPLELWIGTQLSIIPGINSSSTSLIVSGVLLFIVGMIVCIYWTRDFLAGEWRVYKEKLIRNVALTILLAGGTFLVMKLAKLVVTGSVSNTVTTADGEYGIFLLAFSLVPAVIAAFAEELTFRYALLGKFRGRGLRAVMFIVSSVLFGLVHLNNVSGDVVATVPYMIMGAYFGAVYMFTKNIWFAIGTHLLYNASISLLPVLLLIVVSLFQ